MSKAKDNKNLLIGTGVGVLAAGVVAVFILFIIPATITFAFNAQLDKSLPATAAEFEKATADLPRETTVEGSFTGKGNVTLINPETEGEATATLTVTESDYLVDFDGTLEAYTITLTKNTDKTLSFIYDSTTDSVTQK